MYINHIYKKFFASVLNVLKNVTHLMGSLISNEKKMNLN